MTDVMMHRKKLNEMNGHESITVTLLASGWSGESAPYVQTVSCAGITSDNNFVVSPKVETKDEIKTVANAQVLATGQSIGTITFSSFGYKPESDLKFNVKVLV